VPEIALNVAYFALLSLLVELGPFWLRPIVSSFFVCCNLPTINSLPPAWDFHPFAPLIFDTAGIAPSTP
jgi:hypothetical protein